MKNNNIQINIEHYDPIYNSIKTEDIIHKVRNYQSYLNKVTKTETSWHGFYYGDFRSRIHGKKILELGCGNGLNALIMAELGAEVLANDISISSERIIQETASKLQLNNIQFVPGNFSDLQFEEKTFDFIVGKEFLHHLTHEAEFSYLSKVAVLLKSSGEARFFEPAVNSATLDYLRWLIPVPGRPSILNKTAFENYKKSDPHPQRDNSTKHFLEVGKNVFEESDFLYFGSIERLDRLIKNWNFRKKFKHWTYRVESKLPGWFRYRFARCQLIIYKKPYK